MLLQEKTSAYNQPLLATMNGNGVRNPSYSSDYDSRYGSGLQIQPSSKILLEGYNGSLESSGNDAPGRDRYDYVSHMDEFSEYKSNITYRQTDHISEALIF